MPTYPTTSGTRRSHRRAGAYPKSSWGTFFKGLLTAVAVTLGCILLFALLMQWLKPGDEVIRVVNQLIKLVSIFVGVWMMLKRSTDKAMLLGAGMGLAYMGLGVALYALLSGQQLPFSAYLADLAMGVAGGGIAGALLKALRK